MPSDDFAWLIEHTEQITEQYAGKWIAVHDGAVIGVGDTATEAARAAREARSNAEFILEAVERDGDVVYAAV
jgi:NADPH-dependent glutamate synthase beta subunit-like oxidoreductase